MSKSRQEQLRTLFEALDYEVLIAEAAEVFGIEDPEGYKREDLINEMVARAWN